MIYKIDIGNMGKKHKVFHVNDMKKWSSPVPVLLLCLDSELEYPFLDLGKER